MIRGKCASEWGGYETGPILFTENDLKVALMDSVVLKMQRDSLRDALRKVLDTRNEEAKAYSSYQVALENYGSDGRRHWAKVHTDALVAASDAEREARVLLLTLQDKA